MNPHSFALLFPKNSLSTNFNMLTHFILFYTMIYDISYIWSFIYIYYIPIPIPFENSILIIIIIIIIIIPIFSILYYLYYHFHNNNILYIYLFSYYFQYSIDLYLFSYRKYISILIYRVTITTIQNSNENSFLLLFYVQYTHIFIDHIPIYSSWTFCLPLILDYQYYS